MDKSIFSPATVLNVLCHVTILIGFLITSFAVVSGSVSYWIVNYRNKKVYPKVANVIAISLIAILSLTAIVLSVLELISFIPFKAVAYLTLSSPFIAFGMAKTVFDQVPSNKIPRSRFNLSHDKKLSFNQGELIPIMLREAVPGDSFDVSHNIMIRLAPLIGPAYTRMKVKCESFFVPWRILWNEEDYEKWITGGPDGKQTAVHPYFNESDMTGTYKQYWKKGSMWDYMGLPCTEGTAPQWCPKVSVLPFRAMCEIFNSWYAIPGITPLIDYSKSSGVQSTTEIEKLLDWSQITQPARHRAWSRDYFTACQPDAQRGNASIAPIDIAYKNVADVVDLDGNSPTGTVQNIQSDTAAKMYLPTTGKEGTLHNIATAGLLIYNFRVAAAVQKWLEAMSRGGSRYVEMNWQMFKVRGEDQRLQRPEFISGYTGPVQISEVLSTVQFEGASTDLPQGNMAGHGIHVGGSPRWRYTAKEHGYFITIMSVVPEGGRYGSGLYSGVERMWTRFDKYNLFWPLFERFGEQAVFRSELAANVDAIGDANSPTQIFGYNTMYSEYKWAPSTVHADFRDSLDTWTQNRGWAPTGPSSAPLLNNIFTQVDVNDDDLDRIFAVTDPDVDKLWALVYNDVSASRPMSFTPIPGVS